MASSIVCAAVEVAGGGLAYEVGVSVGPSCDVADAVAAGVEAEHSGDDVRDGFGFCLHPAAMLGVLGQVVDVAEGEVRGFMNEVLRRLFRGELVMKHHGAAFRVRVPVRAVQVGGERPGHSVIVRTGQLRDRGSRISAPSIGSVWEMSNTDSIGNRAARFSTSSPVSGSSCVIFLVE